MKLFLIPLLFLSLNGHGENLCGSGCLDVRAKGAVGDGRSHPATQAELDAKGLAARHRVGDE